MPTLTDDPKVIKNAHFSVRAIRTNIDSEPLPDDRYPIRLRMVTENGNSASIDSFTIYIDRAAATALSLDLREAVAVLGTRLEK